MAQDLPLSGRTILVAVDAAPDAFGAAEVVRALVRAGATVRTTVAEETERYLPALTLATLSGAPVIRHREEAAAVSREVDAVVAFAVREGFVADAAAGRATGAVTAAFASAEGSKVAVRSAALPAAPWLTVQIEGLAEVAEVLPAGIPADDVARAVAQACGPRDLEGRRVVVTAGPTREYIDPVRFISNPSTGKMGYALAEAARRRGGDVVLLTGPTSLGPPAGVRVRPFVSAAELMALADEEAGSADVILAAAAVGDYTPETPATEKIKKADGPMVLRLKRTPDVLGTLGERFGDATNRPVLVGFAAETESVVANARSKLEAKHLDLVVANDVTRPGSGFGTDTNEVVLVDRTGEVAVPEASKQRVAHAILDRVAGILAARGD
jgi:phosphopantothenoylcysteine decarboxylase / phosphopantothenate---cysteine ligase